MKINTQKGFIQISISNAIIVGILMASGIGYIGIQQYKNYQLEKTTTENKQVISADNLSEVEKLRQEIEELKIVNINSPTLDTPIPKKSTLTINEPTPKQEIIDPTTISNSVVATDFAIKAQCQQLGLQKKEQEDIKNSYGGAVAYGYSSQLNTCVYGRLYLSTLKSIDNLLFSGQIWDLLTGEQIYHTQPIMTDINTSGYEADKFLIKQKESSSELWEVYSTLIE